MSCNDLHSTMIMLLAVASVILFFTNNNPFVLNLFTKLNYGNQITDVSIIKSIPTDDSNLGTYC